MLLKNNRSSRAQAPEGWQPIGLPARAETPAKVPAPTVFARDLAVARARRHARAILTPGVILATSIGVTSAAVAHDGVLHTPEGDIPVATATPDQIATYGEPGEAVPTTTAASDESLASTTSVTPSSTTSSSDSTSFLPTGDSLPGADIPTVGGFISHAPEIFTGGLFGGETVQTSAPVPEHGEGEHTEGGDACDFFLDHMWKNEDGIPVIGTNEHFLTYHTDPEYYNLILSLASGSIGNSHMPIIDVYGGPLGWIPIMNPEHVKGHGTDYPTMLTGCGGMGLPIDIKTGSVDLEKLPTPEKALALAENVMPEVPDTDKILHPDYLYNTLRVDEITKRLGMESVFTPDEYLSFATDNFDAFRLLWETALEKLESGDPTAVLEVLQVTDNIETLESLGLPGLPGSESPNGDLTGDVPVAGDLLAGLMNGDLSGLPGTPAGGSDPADGSDPGDGSDPTDPSGSGLPAVDGLLGGGSSPLDSLTGILGGSSPTDSTDPTEPTGDPSDGANPTNPTTPTDEPGDEPGDEPTDGTDPTGTSGSGLPVLGDLAGSDSPLDSVTGILGGSSPTDASDATDPAGEPTDGPTDGPSAANPDPTTPAEDPADTSGSGLPAVGDLAGVPGGNLPGGLTDGVTDGDSPTGGLPVVDGLLSGSSPSTDPTPAEDPGAQAPADVAELGFTMGSPQVNGSPSTATVTEGDNVTFTVPVTNTGDAPITSLTGSASDGGTMTGAPAVLQPGETTQLTYTTVAKAGTNELSFNIIGSSDDGQQMAQTCGAAYTAEAHSSGQMALTGTTMVGNQQVDPAATYTFSSTSPSTVTFEVTNTGDAPLESVTATSPAGPVTCAQPSLAPGATTTCAIQVRPESGVNQFKVTFTGVDPSGATTTAEQTFTYTLCTCGAAQAASQNS